MIMKIRFASSLLAVLLLFHMERRTTTVSAQLTIRGVFNAGIGPTTVFSFQMTQGATANFNWDEEVFDLYEMGSLENYQNCNFGPPAKLISDTSPATFLATTVGEFYFSTSVENYCQEGMVIIIRVLSNPDFIPPTVSPSLLPTVAPSFAPTVAPSFAPIVAPSFAPTVALSSPPTVAPSSPPTVRPSPAPQETPVPPPSPSPTPAPQESIAISSCTETATDNPMFNKRKISSKATKLKKCRWVLKKKKRFEKFCTDTYDAVDRCDVSCGLCEV